MSSLDRPITDQTVEHLRQSGASQDLIDFADRYVPRHTARELESQFRIGVWIGGFLGLCGGIAVGYALWFVK